MPGPCTRLICTMHPFPMPAAKTPRGRVTSSCICNRRREVSAVFEKNDIDSEAKTHRPRHWAPNISMNFGFECGSE